MSHTESESSVFKLFGKTIQMDASTEPPQQSVEPAAKSGTVIESRPQQDDEEAAPGRGVLVCPRCKSRHTKFCYFNNDNINQPRHFCKACHRYWTAGGTLRNVPAGGS